MQRIRFGHDEEWKLQTSEVTPSDNKPFPSRMHFIDGLRALAMFFVLSQHLWQQGGRWGMDVPIGGHRLPLGAVFAFGRVGVNLFLVLSGFCLFWPYARSGRQSVNLKEFALKRCRRILPPYYIALALCGLPLLFGALSRHNGVEAMDVTRALILHVLMIHNLFPHYILSINGPMWTLALEFQLYVLFPLLVFGARRTSLRVMAFAAFAFSVLARWMLYPLAMTSWDVGWVVSLGVWGRCFEFALGMWAAGMLAEWQRTGKSPLRRTDLIFAALVLVVSLFTFRHANFGLKNTFWYLPLTDAFFGILFAGLLVAASRSGNLLNRALSAPWLVQCGVFSYSVYLIHLPIVEFCSARLGALGIQGVEMILCDIGVILPLVLLAGYGFHLLFERPFMTPPRPRSAPRPALESNAT